MNALQISVVIPLYNEEESLPELHSWLQRVLNAHSFSYEILFIDDGSKDQSWAVIEALSAKDAAVKGIRFQKNYGKSAALHMGFEAAQGAVVFTMDADLQDSPDEIPELYRLITEEDLDVVSGWKKVRHDPISKTIPTKLYNWAARRITGIYLHDFNCGLKRVLNSTETCIATSQRLLNMLVSTKLAKKLSSTVRVNLASLNLA
jgi:glycosyltransferase involved in cell wall biosynthesis